MIRTGSFLGALGFAAAAAIGSVAWLAILAPVLGGRRALGLWLVGVVAAYVGGLGGRAYRRGAVTLVTAAVGLVLFVIAPGIPALALALVLGVGRTACRTPATALRAVATEAVLLGAGLGFAAMLGGPSLRGVAFAVWGFFLVQSFYFLVPSGGLPRTRVDVDPFEAAHARALVVLQR